MTYRAALDDALDAVKLTPADGAAVELARGYANALDDEGDPARLGPPLLACLAALGMTPAARKAVAGKGVPDEPSPSVNPVDELRQRRAARANGAATVDAALAGTYGSHQLRV